MLVKDTRWIWSLWTINPNETIQIIWWPPLNFAVNVDAQLFTSVGLDIW